VDEKNLKRQDAKRVNVGREEIFMVGHGYFICED
jgi:hypothetical protein